LHSYVGSLTHHFGIWLTHWLTDVLQAVGWLSFVFLWIVNVVSRAAFTELIFNLTDPQLSKSRLLMCAISSNIFCTNRRTKMSDQKIFVNALFNLETDVIIRPMGVKQSSFLNTILFFLLITTNYILFFLLISTNYISSDLPIIGIIYKSLVTFIILSIQVQHFIAYVKDITLCYVTVNVINSCFMTILISSNAKGLK